MLGLLGKQEVLRAPHFGAIHFAESRIVSKALAVRIFQILGRHCIGEIVRSEGMHRLGQLENESRKRSAEL